MQIIQLSYLIPLPALVVFICTVQLQSNANTGQLFDVPKDTKG